MKKKKYRKTTFERTTTKPFTLLYILKYYYSNARKNDALYKLTGEK